MGFVLSRCDRQRDTLVLDIPVHPRADIFISGWQNFKGNQSTRFFKHSEFDQFIFKYCSAREFGEINFKNPF